MGPAFLRGWIKRHHVHGWRSRTRETFVLDLLEAEEIARTTRTRSLVTGSFAGHLKGNLAVDYLRHLVKEVEKAGRIAQMDYYGLRKLDNVEKPDSYEMAALVYEALEEIGMIPSEEK